ncbi:WXG100 family type VII secretion target [Paenibacillus sp. MMS20-IR301]|uniref:WXG100 family type VII secretion target n=1 Tax=Paenibacillus sp. MMS20-IR301 TaxID=2895946 RepID=UPI0028F12EDD|nr:WXG100 family type VII secretion target [Paenibacillus sp. MMS20-IR301]WNS41060.1 WXG100 family type VII secretion target [Paenibacillus sp. MMS20-IR301]
MADKVTVSYDGLATQAKNVLKQKQEYDTLMKKIMTTATTLNSIWEDAAAKEFAEKVKGMQKTFDAFGQALENIGTHMQNVSNSYETLSKEIKAAQNKSF